MKRTQQLWHPTSLVGKMEPTFPNKEDLRPRQMSRQKNVQTSALGQSDNYFPFYRDASSTSN